jgi:hypothetical protein
MPFEKAKHEPSNANLDSAGEREKEERQQVNELAAGNNRPAPELLSSQVAEVSRAIADERAALDNTRAKLGLPNAQSSVQLDALQQRRERLLTQLSQSINPAITHYLVQLLGNDEVSRRLVELSPRVRGQLQHAVLQGNMPLVVHIMELPEHWRRQQEKAVLETLNGSRTAPSVYDAIEEMDAVTMEHDAKVHAIVKSLRSFDPRPINEDEKKLLDIYDHIYSSAYESRTN